MPGLRPEERLVLAAELVDALDRDVTLDVRVAVPDHDRADDVRPRVVAVAVAHRRPVGMERLLLGRPLGIDDELERLVLDDDRLGRAARLLGMLGSDERDRLAVVADAVDREHRLVGELEPVGLAPGDVLVREHGVDAGHRHGLRDVDRDDAGVGMRAAERVPPEHPGRVEVARVRELALHLGRAVRPAGGLADVAELEPGRRLGRVVVESSCPGRGPNRVEDLLVAGAAAEVAGERLADLVVRRARRVVEQVDGGDDQARRAEPALHGSGGEERLLDAVQRTVRPRRPRR